MAIHLRPEEREEISRMLAAGATRKEIADSLGRDRSTIYRELRRNGLRDQYCAMHAQVTATRRRQAARRKSRKLCRPENLAYVQERLRLCWSPDQIAGRSQVDFPAEPGRNFSRQTIYTWIHQDDHKRRWIVFLRHYRRKRRRTASPGRTDHALAKRPEVVNARSRYGDWEGDTIVGPGGTVLLGLVERLSGYLALLQVPSRKAEQIRRALCGRLQQVPAELRHTLTFDNGTEFADYEQIQQTLGMDVFFTDPHAPWQKGTIENTNGLTRQFFPKRTNLGQVSRYKVARAEKLLNERPRKRLHYQTPSEVFAQACYRATHT